MKNLRHDIKWRDDERNGESVLTQIYLGLEFVVDNFEELDDVRVPTLLHDSNLFANLPLCLTDGLCEGCVAGGRYRGLASEPVQLVETGICSLHDLHRLDCKRINPKATSWRTKVRDARPVYRCLWCLRIAKPHHADPYPPDHESGIGLSSVRRPRERCLSGRSFERGWGRQSEVLGEPLSSSGGDGIGERNDLVIYRMD